MPAIASLEDLKAAQEEGLSIYAMLYALCSMLCENGVALVGRICVEPPWEKVEPFKGWVGVTSRPQANSLLCRGKLWL